MEKKTRAEEYAEIPIEVITLIKADKQGIKELVRYVSTMRQGFKRRANQIKRAGMYSYAADKYARDPDDDPAIRQRVNEIISDSLKNGQTIGEANARARNWLVHEFARYSSFFESETSTLTGISDVNRRQDIAIFGKTEEGDPKGTLNLGERRAYWALFNEFAVGDNTAATFNRYGSHRMQTIIGEFVKYKPNEEEDEEKPFSVPSDWSGKPGDQGFYTPHQALREWMAANGYL